MSLAASVATVSTAAIAKPRHAPVAFESRTPNVCPAEAPIYCGWFDKAANLPPLCKARIELRGLLPKLDCPAGKAPYCARDPGNFCPYDGNSEFCLDDGRNRCECFDKGLTADQVSTLLAPVFCVADKALGKLGVNCLLTGDCPGWLQFDLGCTAGELALLVKDGLRVVLRLVGGLLGGLIGGLFGKVSGGGKGGY